MGSTIFVTLLLGMLCAPLKATAQTSGETGVVSGCIADSSGAPLPGVNVVLTGVLDESATVTDASGCYRFADLAQGTHRLLASRLGFRSIARPGLNVEPRQPQVVNIRMPIAALEDLYILPPVTLSSMWNSADLVAHVRIPNASFVGDQHFGVRAGETVDL